MNKDIFEWIPTVRVGPVHFGDDIQKHVETLALREHMDPFDEEKFMCYGNAADDGPAYYLDDTGRVDDIVCFDGLIYNGTDLLGLPIDRVIKLLGQAPDEYGEPIRMYDDDMQITAEFDALGLQLWLRDGIAVSAVVSFANEDEDD